MQPLSSLTTRQKAGNERPDCLHIMIRDNSRKTVCIHIGQYYACTEPTIIQTVLGSCVSACLFDASAKIGGMNHILLPGRADLKKFNVAARYGVNAMELLINEMMKQGAKRTRLQAKVFGGAHMLAGISRENGVGEKIYTFVLDFLNNESIPVLSMDVGGTDSRKIYLYSDTGVVYLKRIHKSYQQRIAEYEDYEKKRLARKINRHEDVTLFN